MKVLIGCEESQAVCIAFREFGHEAFSCDLQDCSGGHPEWHLKMDVFDAIDIWEWDLGVFHPDCTFLTNSAAWAFGDGPYHQKVKSETLVGAARREAREKSLQFVVDLLNCQIKKKVIENPVGSIGTRIFWNKETCLWCVSPKPIKTNLQYQIVHPHQFGDDASKSTVLYRVNVPPLVPTESIPPRVVNGKKRWGNQTDSGQNNLGPSQNRAKIRSKTYPGIARAIAEQWGRHSEL